LSIDVSYSLGDDGLACSMVASNGSARPAPVGLGIHPYVWVGGLVDDIELTLPARTLWLSDGQWRERDRVPVARTDLDFRKAARIGTREIDAAFTDLQRGADAGVQARLDLPDGRRVHWWAGETCRWIVVYSGDTLHPADRRRSIAVEPMTCPPNALASGDDLDVLPPGETLELQWRISVEPPG
jgi:aldose 1-epimerase